MTAAIHGYVATKIEHLESLTEQIVAAHVVLMQDDTKTKRFVVKVHLAVPGPDIHAQDSEADLYAAIDKVCGKLASQLRKRKTKRVLKKKHESQLASEARKGALRR
jgi:putative sigma-54 modulation protein